MSKGRDRPTCTMCEEPAWWIALAEDRLGDRFLGPVDLPFCEAHAIAMLTEPPDDD